MTADTVVVGRVGRPHGLLGAFVVEEASADPRWFDPGARLVVGGDPAEVVERKRAGGRLVIRLDRRVERGAALEVPRSELPPLGEGEYYVFELAGFHVLEEGGRVLGRVVDVTPAPANDVLELDTGEALPMVEECVLEVDVGRRRIVVARGFADAE